MKQQNDWKIYLTGAAVLGAAVQLVTHFESRIPGIGRFGILSLLLKIGILYGIVHQVHRRSPQYDPGFTGRRLISKLFLVGLLPVLILTGAAWTKWEAPKPIPDNLLFALGLVASALWEEAYFRGFGRYLLRDRKRLHQREKWLLAAGACIPALFGLLWDPAGGLVTLLNTAAQSLLLLGVYLAGANLAIPVLLHILFNLGGYLGSYNGVETLFSPQTTLTLWFMSFAFTLTIGLGYINRKHTLL